VAGGISEAHSTGFGATEIEMNIVLPGVAHSAVLFREVNVHVCNNLTLCLSFTTHGRPALRSGNPSSHPSDDGHKPPSAQMIPWSFSSNSRSSVYCSSS